MIELLPNEAWNTYLLDASKFPKWIEDSKDISKEFPLSKRELFGLIILAHLQNHLNGNRTWFVGYDPDASEPNDGFVSDGVNRINIEHKLIPQMSKEDPLSAILSTYTKYANKGNAYGGNRTLIIFPNQTTEGLIKISDLRDKIKNESPFDRVFLIHAVTVKENNTIAVMHITEHYPGKGIAQVDFNMTNGEALIPHYGITQ